jgi:hypothetical protein
VWVIGSFHNLILLKLCRIGFRLSGLGDANASTVLEQDEMIDYRSHVVALDGLTAALETRAFPEAAVIAARDQQIKDVKKEPGWATLGCLMDHLLRHAASDGLELTLLEKAASLWSDGLTIHATLGDSRSRMETALLNPADPGSAEHFNRGCEDLRLLGLKVAHKLDALEALRQQVMKLAHLPEHPRQLDRPLKKWDWGNLFLARRTDAFVRALFADATDPDLRSFAFGALSGYSANVCGSTYLGQVVGGPRRLHRFRYRVASNVVGSWLAQINPKAKTLASIAKEIRFGDAAPTPTLPPSLASFIEKSLRKTYDIGRAASLPDLQKGYSRLVRCLELLDAFNTLPTAPSAPDDVFLARLYADPSNTPPPVLTVAVATPQNARGTSPTNVHPTSHFGSNGKPDASDNAPDGGNACGNFWMGVILAIIFLGGGFVDCIGMWAQGERCKIWDKMWIDFGAWWNPNQPTQEEVEKAARKIQPLTAEGFKAAASVDQMNILVKNMFELHNHVWEGLGKAQTVLATYGLIYPDGMLAAPLFRQFLSVPAQGTYPALPEVDPVNHYHEYPSTQTEHPPVPARYPPGTKPDAVIGSPISSGSDPTSAQIAVNIWSQIARGQHDAVNLDLDADRGFDFKCWATQGSINSDPVGILTLPYEGM